MKFECDSCHAQYMIADEKVGKRGVKVKCKKCQHVIIVRPAKAAKAAGKPAAATPNLEENAEAAAKHESQPDLQQEAAQQGQQAAAQQGDFDDGKTELSIGDRVPDAAALPPVPPLSDNTLASPAPSGLEELRRVGHDNEPAADHDPFTAGEHSSFAVGGPTDPVGASMPLVMGAAAGQAPLESDEKQGRLDHSEEDGEQNRAPAPISMFGDTQLSAPAEPSVPDGAAPSDRTELGAPPQMTMPPQPQQPPAEAAPAAGNDDLLSDHLSGAFSAMFDAQAAAQASAPPEQDDHRGPTRVLDANAVDALRRQTAHRTQEGSFADADSGQLGGVNEGPPPDLAAEGFVVKPPAGADDGPADQVWHVAIDEQDVGPLSVAEVGRHIEGGRVDRETLVWKMGMDNWEPATEVPEIRALFDKVPMPRIPLEDERQNARASRPPDMGLSLEDAPPSSGQSPFDESGEDASWRPHGLTDVYQAANLAEAAVGMGLGGLGGSLAPRSSSSTPLAAQASLESEWRPGAASALASLVQDEIKRIDSPLPPADDELRPADDASLNAPVFGGLAQRSDLDAGPEVTDPTSRPPAPARSSYEPPLVAPSFPPQPGFQTRPPAEASKKLSPLLIGGIAGGGGLLLAIVVLIAVVATRGGDEPRLVMGPDGRPYVMGTDGKLVAVNGSDSKVDAAPAGTDPASAPAEKSAAAAPGTPEAAAAAAATAPAAGEAGALAAAPASDAAENGSAAENASAAENGSAAAAAQAETTTKPAVAKKPPAASARPKSPAKPPPEADSQPATKGCDPVLDFDCKPGKGPTKRPAQDTGPLPDTPSKTDVLVVVKGALPKVQACGKKTGQSGMISMQWQIAPSGKVTSASPKDKHAGTPTGACVTGVVKSLKFPASKKGIPVSFPMKLN